MKRNIRLLLNVLIFLLILAFVWYMARSLGNDKPLFGSISISGEPSQYKKNNSFKTKAEIISFDLFDNHIFIAAGQSVMIYNKIGTLLKEIPVGKEIRDIKVTDNLLYLLYPAEIEIFSLEGVKVKGWQARRPNSDFCSLVLSSEYIFVTDAGNKNICKYTKEGDFMAIILSPNGFIIPSYSFDIINIGDTLYCSNSGRHLIESYSLAGEYITSFGKSGNEAGAFPGCCNPAFLATSHQGEILTSEKGIPRISCFSRDGRFRAILLNSKSLGGGTKAYRLKIQNEKLYIAGKNTISEYIYDPQNASACASCPTPCTLNK